MLSFLLHVAAEEGEGEACCEVQLELRVALWGRVQLQSDVLDVLEQASGSCSVLHGYCSSWSYSFAEPCQVFVTGCLAARKCWQHRHT